MKLLTNKPFVLVRHGETLLNRLGMIGGWTDVVLTDVGRQQALEKRKLMDKYEWERVFVSPLLRAQETADLLAPDAEKMIEPDLKERHWGILEGQPQTVQIPYEETPQGGESWDEMCSRVVSALNHILDNYEFPLIIAHSGIFRVLRQLAYGSPYGERAENVVPYYIEAKDGDLPWDFIELEKVNDA